MKNKKSSKELLFERMHKVAGMSLNEELDSNMAEIGFDDVKRLLPDKFRLSKAIFPNDIKIDDGNFLININYDYFRDPTVIDDRPNTKYIEEYMKNNAHDSSQFGGTFVRVLVNSVKYVEASENRLIIEGSLAIGDDI
jgi:hypothetical protein